MSVAQYLTDVEFACVAEALAILCRICYVDIVTTEDAHEMSTGRVHWSDGYSQNRSRDFYAGILHEHFRAVSGNLLESKHHAPAARDSQFPAQLWWAFANQGLLQQKNAVIDRQGRELAHAKEQLAKLQMELDQVKRKSSVAGKPARVPLRRSARLAAVWS